MTPGPTSQTLATGGGLKADIKRSPIAAWRDLPRRLKGVTRKGRELFLKSAASHAKTVVARGSPGSIKRSWMAKSTSYMARVHSMAHPPKVHTLEVGRRAGAPQPPIAEIERNMAGRIRESAYVIARAIRRRGTRGRFFRQAALRSTQAAIPGLLRQMARRVEQDFRKGI